MDVYLDNQIADLNTMKAGQEASAEAMQVQIDFWEGLKAMTVLLETIEPRLDAIEARLNALEAKPAAP